jgi:2-aminoadipate transaminase
MNTIFSDRIADVPRSFIREILKVSLDRTVISFAGGLPNRDLFPAEEIKKATARVFEIYGNDIFQYSNSEGGLKLRQYIAKRYKEKKNLDIHPENILITNGAQQGLDLIGKTLLNEGEGVIIEEPGYLGAIQAFSIYRPKFLPVTVAENGVDIAGLKKIAASEKAKLMYTVPNFQNPCGITYSDRNRREIVDILSGTSTFLVEDDPYGELRFSGERKTPFAKLMPGQTILLGSFSKIVVPGFRVGWIVAPEHIFNKLLVAKQASDLHTCHFTQYIIHQYLLDNDIDAHIAKIVAAYGGQCRKMLGCIEKYFPADVEYTRPEGGMFLWAKLPGAMASLALFELAVKEKVIFVPGDPFYTTGIKSPAFRLNFSCVDEATIETGIERLGKAIRQLAS